MNGDLDSQLEEMGGGYRTVVDRLRRAAEVEPRTDRVRTGRFVRSDRAISMKSPHVRTGWLVAASLALVLGLGVVLWGEIGWRTADSGQQTKVGGHSTFDTRLSARDLQPSTFNLQPSPPEYRLAHLRSEAAVAEMIRTQQADGGWRNDFLTRQNAEALKLCDSREAKIAYKKALRNLRVKGVL